METEQKELRLSFNDPENPYSGFALHSKISQRSRIIDDLVTERVSVGEALIELQNVDDSIINELMQHHSLTEHWQQEAAKWRAQAQQIEAAFAQYQRTHF